MFSTTFNRWAISAVAVLALAGCSESKQAPASETKKETPAPSASSSPPMQPSNTTSKWSEIRVAIDPTYKPFTYKTPAGEPTGFDVDIAKALCDTVKAKCTFIEQSWDGMIPGLLAKKYDAIISSMSITEERKKSVAFTNKYYNTPSCIVVKTALKLDGSPASMKGKKIGVLKASTQEKFAMGELQSAGATIVPYDAQDKVYLDIKAKRLDGTVADVVEVTGGFLSTPDGKDYSCAGGRIPASFDEKYFGVGVGVALRQEDSDLQASLNQAIKTIRDNGQWKTIAEKHVPGIDLWGE